MSPTATRATKAQRAEHLAHLEKQNTLLSFFLFDTIRQRKADATAEDDAFSLVLFRADGAHGGYVVLYQIAAQAVSLHYLDDLTRYPWEPEIRTLAGKLEIQRNRIFYSV